MSIAPGLQYKFPLDLSKVPGRVYLVKINTGKEIQVRKLIKH